MTHAQVWAVICILGLVVVLLVAERLAARVLKLLVLGRALEAAGSWLKQELAEMKEEPPQETPHRLCPDLQPYGLRYFRTRKHRLRTPPIQA